jgi:hypothetical protein
VTSSKNCLKKARGNLILSIQLFSIKNNIVNPNPDMA